MRVSLLATLTGVLLFAQGAIAQVQFIDATVDCGLLPTLDSGQTVTGMRSGLAVGDFNRDGHQDIFVLGNNLRADALFISNGDGSFTDRAPAWGVDVKHRGGGACVGDVDGDGWLDIYVTSEGGKPQPKVGQHLLWHYENGRFVNRAKVAGVARTSREVPDGFGCAFGDYDLDGDLDLYVTGWRTFPPASKGNVLFRNEGNMKFKRVTEQAGLGHLIALPSFAPSFVDMDGDRYPELLLASDFGTSRYMVNNGDGTFRDWTDNSGTSQETNGMGSTIGDFNNDGLIDWYVTSVDTSGGNGNKLYLNLGSHRYREVAKPAGVGAGWWGWGAVTVDVDLDGWQDIMETNGWGSATYSNKPSLLWMNNRDMTFSEVGQASGFDHTLNGLGMVNLDIDEDGDQDVVISTAHFGQLRLYRNEQTTGHHWLRVTLNTSGSPGLAPDGYGSRIEVVAGGKTQVRMMENGCKYLSTSEMVAAFGLEDATVVDEVRVYWNDGTVKTWTDVPVDRHITLKSW